MKLEILQEELVKGLALVSRAVASRPQLPVLSNILIEAKKEGLYLSATDLELGIGLNLNAKVTEEGLITVPAKSLVEFVGSLNPGRVEIATNKDALAITSGSYKAKFQTISADEFPRLPDSLPSEKVSINYAEFAIASQTVLFAAARDSLRPVLTGILLEVRKNHLNVVATDGFRLATRKVTLQGDMGSETVSPLVPMRAVAEVARLNLSGELELYYIQKANQVIFKSGDIQVVTQIIEGNYPDYNKIIPKEFASEVVVQKEELLQAVKATYIFARENSNMMRWTLTKGELTITAESPERGDAVVTVPIELDGEGGEVVFNAKFVLDFLTVTSAGTLKFGMGSKLAPCAFREDKNDDFLYVVMPINA